MEKKIPAAIVLGVALVAEVATTDRHHEAIENQPHVESQITAPVNAATVESVGGASGRAQFATLTITPNPIVAPDHPHVEGFGPTPATGFNIRQVSVTPPDQPHVEGFGPEPATDLDLTQQA